MVKGCRSAAFIAVALSALLALSPAESFAVGVQETVVGSSATVSEGSSLPPTSSGKGDAGRPNGRLWRILMTLGETLNLVILLFASLK